MKFSVRFMPNWTIEKPMPLELITLGQPATGIPDERGDCAREALPRSPAWINPEWAWLAEAYSLDRLDGIEAVTGCAIDQEPTRSTIRRCEVSIGVARRQALRVRIERQPSWGERCWEVVRGQIRSSAMRREFEITRRLQDAGFGVLTPLVFAPRGRKQMPGWLVLLEPAASISLDEHLADIAAQHPHDRLKLIAQLGREITRWHTAGYVHGQLTAEHVLLVEEQPARFVLVELGTVKVGRQATLADRAEDLALLLTSLAAPLTTRAERDALFDSYLSGAKLGVQANEFRRQVNQSRERLAQQLERQKSLRYDTRALSPIAPFESSENCRVWCDVRDQQALRSGGLGSFDQVMATQSGRLLRTLANRENWRIELRGSRGAYGAYLKKHRIVDWKMKLRARLRLAPQVSEGRVEAENVALLESEGIPTMRLVAFGERSHADGLQESFVLTEELAGFMQLDHYLPTRFALRDPARGRVDNDLATLIREVARVAREFHRWGHNHRDFYLCHFFVREARPGKFEVKLIDLQRVQTRRWNRTWLVLKDLTQLAYSAPLERFGCRERVLFLHHYLDVPKLQPRHKRLVRRILAKQRWKQWRLGPHV